VLSGERLPMEKGRILRRPHFLSNANTALQFLAGKRIKLVNINATDIVDGRPSIVLGLIWTIILFYQIEENTRQIEQLGRVMDADRCDSPFTGDSGGGISRDRPPSVTRRTQAAEKWKMGAKKALLEWVRHVITKRFGIIVNDFGTSWRDGNAFLAIIHCINPRLVNLQAMTGASNKARLDEAFRIAEQELGIAHLLDSEDVDVNKPDEKSIMCYVAQFLNKYPEPGVSQVPEVTGSRLEASQAGISEVETEYMELTSWVTHTVNWLQTLSEPHTYGNFNYDRLKAVRVEAIEKKAMYGRLKALKESQASMVSITQDSWSQCETSW
ncbi:unnamed protein product, partial [Meganyctiphanes norvegica]